MKSCTVRSKVPYLPEYGKFLMLNNYFYVVCIFKAEIILQRHNFHAGQKLSCVTRFRTYEEMYILFIVLRIM